MLVRFLRNYRGYRTDERLFYEGDVAEVRPNHGRGLIAEGWAEKADDKTPDQPREVTAAGSGPSKRPLIDVPGASRFADAFKDVGIHTAFDLAHAGKTMLTRAQGVGEKRAEQLQQAARDLLYPEPEPEVDNGAS